MAIDTAAKRKSAMNVGLIPIRLGVIPDGANLEAGQRLHVQGLYSGILATEVVAPSEPGTRRRLRVPGRETLQHTGRRAIRVPARPDVEVDG